ncbi:MAG: MFS transporter [Thermoplasmata archaeon]
MSALATPSGGSTRRPTGFRAFLIVWAGQLTSILGTGMTTFVIIFFAFQVTQSATVLALVALSAFLPTVAFSPFAGTWVDRWNRKLVLVLADLGAGVSTAILLVLHLTGNLEIWHLYPIVAIAGAFSAFHFPAYSAAVTLMIPKEHYARASGLISMAGSLSGILAPILAPIFLVQLGELQGLTTVFTIDIVTVFAAVGTVAFVHIPQPAETKEGAAGKGSFWKELAYGFRYIFARRSLLNIQLIFFGVNFVASLAFVLTAPLILTKTAGDALALGTVLAAGAIGQVVGGAVLGFWGGPKRRIHGVLLGMVLSSLLGEFLFGFAREVIVWSAALFLSGFFIIFVNGSNQAIWQSKVAPDVQGRVFAVRRLIAQISAPAAFVVGGFAADFVFEPAMSVGGALAPIFGGLLGVGPGSGISLMFILAGIGGALIGLAGYAFRSVRDAEDILPDHEARVADEPGGEG